MWCVALVTLGTTKPRSNVRVAAKALHVPQKRGALSLRAPLPRDSEVYSFPAWTAHGFLVHGSRLTLEP